MPFFMVDDQFHLNEKSTKLARRALRGDLSGLAAHGLWSNAGSLVQAKLSDGHVSFEDLVSLTLNPAVVTQLADLLVDAGLWHTPGHGCERCPAVAEDSWLFHDWFALGYQRGAQIKATRDKMKELKDPALLEAVWARDCIDPSRPTVGRCRYCLAEVKRNDRKSELRPEMDHVDPTKAIGARNVVLSCLSCNRKKGRRTPAAADMVLQPAPSHSLAAGSVQKVSPGNAAAGTSPESPTVPRDVEAVEKSNRRIKSDIPGQPNLISEEKTIPCGRAIAGAQAGQGRAGQGLGKEGSGEGSSRATASPTPPRSSRSRNRGKGKNLNSRHGTQPNPGSKNPPKPSAPALAPMDAGPAPEVEVAGTFGSPWYGWSGRPSNVSETTCTDHGLQQPCRRCIQESENA